jgi:acyl-CoA thioesterase I
LNKNFAIYGCLLLIIQVLIGCDNPNSQNDYRAESNTTIAAGAGCTSNTDLPPNNDPSKTRHVIAFGDSLYAGYKLGPCDGFAPQLQAALRNNGLPVTILNAGVSGDTTSAGLARLRFVLDNAPHPPEIVILGLGGNDMLRGIKPAETRDNLMKMLDELKRRNIKIILTGMLASPNMGPDYAKSFNPIYPELARKYDIPLYPFFFDGIVTDKKMMLDDGIHPNKQGIAIVVSRMQPIMEAALKQNKD